MIVKEIVKNKMKICAIICEYNPFHNGHLYQLREAKRRSGADALLCIMSGNFVQRGEGAIVDKWTRAKHAITAGADLVIELPTLFSTSNAELFAKGAVHILSSIPEVEALCFGAENADEQAFFNAARLLNDEPPTISARIQALTAEGASYAKARATAYADYLPSELLQSPNNILGLEYTRAILATSSTIRILPIERVGSGYKENVLLGAYPSATAIRTAIEKGEETAGYLPDFVYRDLPKTLENRLDGLEKYAILQNTPAEIARVCDCTEGLENAFKRAAELNAPLVETLTSPRYTSSRIRRIALQNLLGVEEGLIRESLRSPLYLRILGANKERKEVLTAVSRSMFPALIRGRDEENVQGVARDCLERDIFAEKLYGLLYPSTTKKEIFWTPFF